MKVKMIFAVGYDNEFSLNGELPWQGYKVLGDMEHFVNYTRDAVVIMGHGTWDSLPQKLPNRINVVLSKGPVSWKEHQNKRGHTVVTWPDEIFERPLQDVVENMKGIYPNRDIVIIGGAKLLEEASNFVDEASVTLVEGDYPKECETLDKMAITQNLANRSIVRHSIKYFSQYSEKEDLDEVSLRQCVIIEYRYLCESLWSPSDNTFLP